MGQFAYQCLFMCKSFVCPSSTFYSTTIVTKRNMRVRNKCSMLHDNYFSSCDFFIQSVGLYFFALSHCYDMQAPQQAEFVYVLKYLG